MTPLSRYRWPLLVVLPSATLAAFAQLGLLQLTYQAEVALHPIGKTVGSKQPTSMTFKGEGPSALTAAVAARKEAAAYIAESVVQGREPIQQTISKLNKEQAAYTTRVAQVVKNRQNASKGSVRAPWTPALARQYSEIKARRDFLVSGYPTHSDIRVLNQQLQALEAQQRGGRGSVSGKRVTDFGREIAELQTQSSWISHRIQEARRSEKNLKSNWKITPAENAPRWPTRISGWLSASVAALGIFFLGFFLTRPKSDPKPMIKDGFNGLFRFNETMGKPVEDVAVGTVIPLQVIQPDHTLSARASELYDQWLQLVRTVYAPSAEPPEGVIEQAEHLVSESIHYMAEGQDAMSQHLARLVIPGDLPSHVTRTVLMALLGSLEAGASAEQQKVMTFAALFHDLAVVPRPEDNWDEIGAEVGRLSASFVQKIPGLTPSHGVAVESLLIGMDEYAMDTWQNVPRDKSLESFSKLLRQIDRFDKVMQKQKVRITRRLAYDNARLAA